MTLPRRLEARAPTPSKCAPFSLASLRPAIETKPFFLLQALRGQACRCRARPRPQLSPGLDAVRVPQRSIDARLLTDILNLSSAIRFARIYNPRQRRPARRERTFIYRRTPFPVRSILICTCSRSPYDISPTHPLDARSRALCECATWPMDLTNTPSTTPPDLICRLVNTPRALHARQ